MQKDLPMKSENIPELIHFFRGEKVLLYFDLAVLYGVEVKRLKEAVRRNINRFPPDFLFELSTEEMLSLRTQIASLKRGQHQKYAPSAFTKLGVAMLSSVLKSEQAINVNIEIMRAFVQLRNFLALNRELALRIKEPERNVSGHDDNIALIFETIKQMIEKKNEPRVPVGFKIC